MSCRRSGSAARAALLAVLASLAFAGAAARDAARTGFTEAELESLRIAKDLLNPGVSAPVREATVSIRQDGRKGMGYILEQLDRCWTRVAQMPREPLAEAEKETLYCAAYAYAARAFDRGGTDLNGTPPTPGLDQQTIDAKVQDALIRIGYPAEVAPAFADVVQFYTLTEGALFVSPER